MTARTLARMPDQGPPALPAGPTVLADVDWKGTRWQDGEGNDVALEGAQALQVLTPCAAVGRRDGEAVHYTRVEPPCRPEEQGYGDPDQRFATFTLNTNDHYTFMGDEVVWRHGPERAFKHPRGTRRRRDEGGWSLLFGVSRYVVHRLDGCQVVFVHDSDRAYRGLRTFPACSGAERSYDGWSWSLWELADGTRLDLRQDTLHIDRAGESEDLVLPIAVEGEALRVGEAGPGQITMRKTGPCVAEAIRGDQTLGASRLFPRCD